MNERRDQQAASICDDVTLAALDLFAGVITARPSAFSGFHALAVNDASAGRGRAACSRPAVHDQLVIDRGP